MKQILSGLFFSFLRGTKGWPLKSRHAGDVQILMFHRVVDAVGKERIVNDGIEVTAAYLEKLILYYKRHRFIPAAIGELPQLAQQPSGRRHVIFTFDDGYADNYEKALPVFEKYNIPFAVYITTDFIERKQFAWWYYLEDLLQQHAALSFSHRQLQRTISCGNAGQKEHAFGLLREEIQADPSLLDSVLAAYPAGLEKYHDLFLTGDQLRRLSAHPLVTVGAHSISHMSLAKSSDAVALREIAGSKVLLEKMTGKKVLHFAYPFGTGADVSKREVRLAEEAGYVTALTTAYGDVHLEKDLSLFALPRIWTAVTMPERELLKIVSGYNEWRSRKGA